MNKFLKKIKAQNIKLMLEINRKKMELNLNKQKF